jgi:Ca2+-binding EF-hand superfamily protein
LKERGFLSIRAIAQLFKSIDKNGNRKIDPEEFFWGLNAFGISLTQEEASDVVRTCDTNRDGHVSLDEFIVALRGELNDYRKSYIRQAY